MTCTGQITAVSCNATGQIAIVQCCHGDEETPTQGKPRHRAYARSHASRAVLVAGLGTPGAVPGSGLGGFYFFGGNGVVVPPGGGPNNKAGVTPGGGGNPVVEH